MSSPKPMAPTKPLAFTPPQKLRGQTRSSELPFVKGAESNVMERKKRPQNKKKFTPKRKGLHTDIAIVDEHVKLDGGVVLTLGEVVTELIGTPSNPKKVGTKKEEKKPFVLDEHLTQRPFKDDRLMQLKADLQRQLSQNR